MLMTSQRVKNCDAIVREIAPFRPPVFESPLNLLRNYGEAIAECRRLASDIQQFLHNGYELSVPLPEVQVAGAEVATLPYRRAAAELEGRYDELTQAIAGMFANPLIGRFGWHEQQAARFTFIEVTKERGWLRTARHREQHVHDLVKPVSHRLTENLPIHDERARQLIRVLPSALRPYARVITGLEIVQGHEYLSSEETLTALGRFVQGSAEYTAAVVQSVSGNSARVAVGAGAAALGVIGLLGGLVQVVIADPALVVGEYCLWGWQD